MNSAIIISNSYLIKFALKQPIVVVKIAFQFVTYNNDSNLQEKYVIVNSLTLKFPHQKQSENKHVQNSRKL